MMIVNRPLISDASEILGHPLEKGGKGWFLITVGLAQVIALLLPLNLLATQPFHHDEALYATWGLEIASGQNPWLAEIPIDKPPLFIYMVAGGMKLLGPTETAARLPSLLATFIAVGLTGWLGRTLYGPGVGAVAAWLVALSPFTILFAPTAFTDPMLIALVLAACQASSRGRTGWAGLGLGLAIATKQQGLFFAPLVGALGWLGGRPPKQPFIRLGAGLGLSLLALLAWELAHPGVPGFWGQSLANYGSLTTGLAAWPERGRGFMELLYYAAASPLLTGIFAVGLAGLLLWRDHRLPVDGTLLLFCLGYLGLHTFLSFQVWDRYLLGLIPLLALLLARILLLPCRIWPRPAVRSINGLAVGLLLILTLAGPVQEAANARYPLGSNSQALRGIHQAAAYLRSHIGANQTLHHRWLGTHWRFYLWGYPYDLRYWDSPEALAATAKPGHLIAFPGWQSETEARLALAGAGLTLEPLSRAYAPAGYPSIILYRIEDKQP